MFSLAFWDVVNTAVTYGRDALTVAQVGSLAANAVKGTRGILVPERRKSKKDLPEAEDNFKFYVRYLHGNEIRSIYDFEKNLIGQMCTFEDYVRDFKRNSQMNFVVERTCLPVEGVNQQKSEVVGVFSLYPITREARKRLEAGELLGIDTRPDDFVDQGHPAEAIYIGGIAANGNLNKLAVEVFCERELYNVSFSEESGRAVFTTPFTDSGLRAAIRNEFEPFDLMKTGKGSLYSRSLPDVRPKQRPKAGEVLAALDAKKRFGAPL